LFLLHLSTTVFKNSLNLIAQIVYYVVQIIYYVVQIIYYVVQIIYYVVQIIYYVVQIIYYVEDFYVLRLAETTWNILTEMEK